MYDFIIFLEVYFTNINQIDYNKFTCDVCTCDNLNWEEQCIACSKKY